jgi:Tfp pilus assembly protein PilF
MTQPTDPNRTVDESPRQESVVPAAPSGRNLCPAIPVRLQLFEEIARGGMGAVLRGRDDEFGRDVAVKVLLEAHQGKSELTQRFLEEARIAARLQHPGVAPVYAMGRLPDGRPYFAMKLVQGRTLARLLSERKDPADGLPRFLAVFEQLCQTVAYAHSRGVLHRDLKPANVMVGEFGEVQVMDWGLAKARSCDGATASASPTEEGVRAVRPPSGDGPSTAEGAPETQPGVVLGTPAYMAPEQARGEAVDERADVFGLGAVLCEVLTGRPPFAAKRPEALELARRADLADAFARLDGCGAGAELIGLAKRCLAADPAERPRDAGAAAAAVTAYRESVERRLRAIEVAQAEAKAKAVEMRKRRRLRWSLAALVALLAVAAAGAGLWYAWDRAARRSAAESAAAVALARADQAADQAREIERKADLAGAEEPETAETARQSLALWRQAEEAVDEAERVLAAALGVQEAQGRLAARREEVEVGRGRAEKVARLIEGLDDARFCASNAVSGELDFDYESAASVYAETLRSYGVNVSIPDAAAAIRDERPAVRLALVVALDDWASDVGGSEAARLRRIADAADDDGWRRRIRAAGTSDGEELKRLGKEIEAVNLPAVNISRLAAMLTRRGLRAEAALLLRPARLRYPTDFWIHYGLGSCLHDPDHPSPGTRDEVVGSLWAAVALRPGSAAAHNGLGVAFFDKGDLDAAVACYRRALELDPTSPLSHYNLGYLLAEKHKPAEAEKEYREAIRIKHDFPEPHNQLGMLLERQGKPTEAEEEYRETIRLRPNDPKAHNNLGVLLEGQNKPMEAEKEYREAIRLRPDFPDAHNNLGALLRGQNKPAEAEKEFREAIRIRPDLADAHDNLGNLLASQNQPAEAEKEYREAIRIKPDFAEAHSNFGNLLAGQNRPAEAEEEYREAIRLRPDDPGAYCNLGILLKRQNKPAEAEEQYREAIRIRPDFPEAHKNLGLLLERQGKPAEAEKEYREAIRLRPNYATAHCDLGVLLKAQNKPAGAEKEYREAIRINPELAEAHYNLGLLLAAQNKPTEAEKEYHEAIRLRADNPEAHLSLGILLQGQNQPAEAEKEYREAIRIKPDVPEAHNNLGLLLERQGKPAEAEKEYREAIRLRPEFADAHNNLGLLLKAQGKPAEAGKEYREAIRIKPDVPEAHNNLGLLLKALGKPEEAEKEYREALRLRPEFADAHNNLGLLLKALGKPEEAEKEYRETLRIKPDLAEAHLNLGVVLRSQGQPAEAEKEYREAIRLRPDYAEPHNNLGNLLADQGQPAEAEKEYREAVRLRPDYAEAHCNLGLLLERQGQPAEAEKEYCEAIRLRPDYAEAHYDLGFMLRNRGRFREALEELRRGHELGSRRPGWTYRSAAAVEECRRLVEFDSLLPAVLNGAANAADADAALWFTRVCQKTQRHAAAARLSAGVIDAVPEAANDPRTGIRYRAACSATLAGCGKGLDAPADEAERARLRARARAWLRADLAGWAKAAESGNANALAAVRGTLPHWQQDADLAGVRDADALAKLPEAEQGEWKKLWEDVAAVLKAAEPPK